MKKIVEIHFYTISFVHFTELGLNNRESIWYTNVQEPKIIKASELLVVFYARRDFVVADFSFFAAAFISIWTCFW